MLGGKNFGGGHHAGLASVVERHQHCHEGHDGFSRADISLDQAVHLASGANVSPYFFQYAFLGSGQREGEDLRIEVIEESADSRKMAPLDRGRALVGVAAYIQLEVEKFLEFEPEPGAVQLVDGSLPVSGNCIPTGRYCGR